MSAAVWAAQAAPSTNDLVRQHAPLVRRIALHLIARLPAEVELDDLIQSGTLGLLEAAQKFQFGTGASFETFAGYRIRGAILDELRRGDWAPRSVHRSARELQQARIALEQELGRQPSAFEMAERLEIPVEDYQQLADDASLTHLVSLDEGGEDDEDGLGSALRSLVSPIAGPATAIEKQDLAKHLADAIRSLPERDQLVLSLYYTEELHQHEIGEVLGVTESRVSQLHSRALKALRQSLADWMPAAYSHPAKTSRKSETTPRKEVHPS